MRARALVAGAAVALTAATPARANPPACAPPAPGGEWRQMGRDFGHSRTQGAPTTLTPERVPGLRPVWTFSANDAAATAFNEITGYPLVADGCVYVGSSTGLGRPGWVFALNAADGALVWKRRLSHGVYSTLAVEGGRVYAYASRIGAPYVAALDQADGRVLWERTVDTQPGSDAVSSPVVYDGMIWVGVSGTAAEGNSQQRFDFRGASVLLDAADGRILAYTPTIPGEALARDEAAGGAIWSTISIDPETRYGYVGTGNPFSYEHEHEHTNAVLKIDLRRESATLGGILGHYKGDVEEYFADLGDHIPCDDDNRIGVFLGGFECGHLDLDFGAAPNLFEVDGVRLVGAGQKSGVYHVFDAGTMEPVWKQVVGVPSAVGGIVGTPAYDGRTIYVPHTLAGYLVALDARDGARRWVAPVGDGVHWGNPVTHASGVVYTVDLKGFLDAYDAATGAPLLHRPIWLEAGTGADATATWGGATVARDTVYASVGLGLTSVGDWPPWPRMTDGFVVAFR